MKKLKALWKKSRLRWWLIERIPQIYYHDGTWYIV